MSHGRCGTLVVSLFYLTACSFAPHSHRPQMPIPQHYKEAVTWVLAQPSLALSRIGCHWWMVYGDPVLDDLEVQLTRTNPTLNEAFSRFQEARALAQEARSQLYPTILGLGSASRQNNSSTVANVYAGTKLLDNTFGQNNSNRFTGTQLLYNTFTLQGLLSYEVDVWGQIRNSVAASNHAARASEFDMAAVDLSLHANLAEIYFEWQGQNQQQHVLDRLVTAYEHALFLTHQLHQGGAVSALEEDQACALLEQAKTNATNMRLSRAKLEHALAVLIGAIPANFKVPSEQSRIRFVPVAPSLPSALLQQRPDVAAAAERVQSANATIGVARAAFFPAFTISSMLGLQTQNTGQLFSRPSLIWGLGPASGVNMIPPQVNQIIFDGFYLQANLKHAKAAYYAAVNQYRETVLNAYREVEDGLVASYRLHLAIASQRAATKAAMRALYQVNQRMANGMDTYLNVVGIEAQALEDRYRLIQLNIDGQLASIRLIKALGGGWDIKQALRNKI